MKPFLGHWVLKYSPESYRWFSCKNAPAYAVPPPAIQPNVKRCAIQGSPGCCGFSEEMPFITCPTAFCSQVPWGVFAPRLQGTLMRTGPLCEIPVNTLHWETGFSDTITFWDPPISWFLSLVIVVCIALCAEMVIFFNKMSCVIKWNALQCWVWQCCYFYQSNCISKKKQYQIWQKYRSALICLCIQKSNQSAKPQQIRKYIQLFKFSKGKSSVHPSQYSWKQKGFYSFLIFSNSHNIWDS